MTTPVQMMLEKYSCKNAQDYKNALKEIIQEVALCGLSRGGFFQKAAFYGGTALRIFYGLNRFSEDLDFSLCETCDDFKIENYFDVLAEELKANGFDLSIEKKEKAHNSAVQSAFLKGGTLFHILQITARENITGGISESEKLKIKFEVDTNPPPGAEYETKYALNPFPYAVKMYDEPSLFAGKLHALLCRKWKSRVKGRDFYDYVWYLSRNTAVNICHLQKRLEQTGHWEKAETLDLRKLKEMLETRFEQVNFDDAKKDVRPFLSDDKPLELWSADFFKAITQNLRAAQS